MRHPKKRNKEVKTMQDLPKETTTKHKLVSGKPVPNDMMNEWGYPSSEHLVFVGCETIRNKHTRVDEKTDEKHKVLIVSHINTWKKVNPNEKTATQLKKEKAQPDTPKPKKPSKQELKDECKAMGLKVSGNMSQLQERLDAHYASLPTTDDLSIDDEGNVINPAKEESE